MINGYIIQHRHTGAILTKSWNKGASYWNGEADSADSIPLIFNLSGAKSFRAQWTRWEFYTRHYYSSDYEYEAELEFKDVGRQSTDLLIIPITITLGEPL